MTLPVCYVCAMRPGFMREAAGAPVCQRCLTDVLGYDDFEAALKQVAVTPTPPPKTVAAKVTVGPGVEVVDGRAYYVAIYQRGGCIACGGGERDNNTWTCDSCWNGLTEDEKDVFITRCKVGGPWRRPQP